MAHEFSKIEEALEALAAGRLVIVVDDEDRENEGDFIGAAEKVTPEMIAFMITHGDGPALHADHARAGAIGSTCTRWSRRTRPGTGRRTR